MKQKKIEIRIDSHKTGFTSPNRIVYASPLKRLGLRKTAVGLTPFVRFSLRHIFGVAGTASQFLYRNPKNVVYNFYVMCNMP
jgi:hypothetical protein